MDARTIFGCSGQNQMDSATPSIRLGKSVREADTTDRLVSEWIKCWRPPSARSWRQRMYRSGFAHSRDRLKNKEEKRQRSKRLMFQPNQWFQYTQLWSFGTVVGFDPIEIGSLVSQIQHGQNIGVYLDMSGHSWASLNIFEHMPLNIFQHRPTIPSPAILELATHAFIWGSRRQGGSRLFRLFLASVLFSDHEQQWFCQCIRQM